MKQIHRNYTLLVLFSLFIIGSCSKDDETKIEKLSGYAQKGPFITGTTVELHELNTRLEQTGRIFTTQVYHDAGLFEFNNLTLSSRYAEFFIRGNYYDETGNGFPMEPIELSAITDISDKTNVNINVLTTLEKARVKYLVTNGLGFADAKSKAQAEILASFGFINEIDLSENLDISQDSDGNAILLAISTMISGVRYQGFNPTSFLGNISSDIETDGILDDSNVLAYIRYYLCRANTSVIRSNLVNRYAYLGVSASIPGFEYYLNLVMPAKPIATVRPVVIITSTSAQVHGYVFPNTLSTDVVFEYGTDLIYGNTAIASPANVSGCREVELSASISGLAPATIYHFRVKATNSLGTSYSIDQQFTTR